MTRTSTLGTLAGATLSAGARCPARRAGQEVGVDLRDVDAFVQAADAGTFTAAASRLYTTQPSLSRRIARLEQGVGGALFDRSNRRVLRLSPLGEEILPHARQLLAEYDRFLDLVRARSEGRDGTVTIAVPVAMAPVVLPRLYGFIERWLPDVRIRVVEVAGRAGAPDAVAAGEAEIGILEPDLLNGDLESVTFGVVTQVALGHPDLLGPDEVPVEWSELRRLPLLLPLRASEIESVRGGPELVVAHELGVPSTLLAMAQSRHGVALLAGFAAREGLVRRPVAISGAVQRLRLQLAWRSRSVLPSPVRRMVFELRQRLATRQPADLDEAPRPESAPPERIDLRPHADAVSRDAGLALEAVPAPSLPY